MSHIEEIIAAIELAIADHRASAGQLTDWKFVGQLREAQRLLIEFEETAKA